MAKLIFPSSFICDCGQQCHFFENTIREMKKMSIKKKVKLGSDSNHTIVFVKEDAIEIICPKLGICKIDNSI